MIRSVLLIATLTAIPAMAPAQTAAPDGERGDRNGGAVPGGRLRGGGLGCEQQGGGEREAKRGAGHVLEPPA